MPRQRNRKNFLNFVGGLNTESSPLVFPENTAKSIDNIDLNRDGSLKRRRGLNYEPLGVLSSTTFAEASYAYYAVSAHEWKSVEGDDFKNFLVVQIGGILYFHKLGETVLSSNYIGSIDLGPIQTRDDYEEFVVSTAVGKGKLFVVSRAISPAYIQYDADTDSFTGVKLTIKVRDIDGINEDRDSPIVFGAEVTPDEGVDPVDDIDDITIPLPDPIFGGIGTA